MQQEFERAAMDPGRAYTPKPAGVCHARAAVVAVLGLSAGLASGVSVHLFLAGGAGGRADKALLLAVLGVSVLIAGAAAVAASSVNQVAAADAKARLEIERLGSKAALADSLQELRHDYDNQLTVILALLQLGRIERAVDYVQGIVGRKRHPAGSGAPETLVALIGEKILEAIESNVSVRCDVAACPLPPVPIESITRIVGNLFDNAIEAAAQAPGGGEVRARVYACEGRWTFEIWNNGAVIPKEMIERVFEAGVTTKQEAQGHGLGLAAVRRLVAAHQGTVSVDSDPKRGTTFFVSFALAPAFSAAHDR